MEFYLAIKINEVLIRVTTWMSLADLMLCERNQSQENTPEIRQIYRLVFVRARGVIVVGSVGSGCRGVQGFFLVVVEDILKLFVEMVALLCEYIKND